MISTARSKEAMDFVRQELQRLSYGSITLRIHNGAVTAVDLTRTSRVDFQGRDRRGRTT